MKRLSLADKSKALQYLKALPEYYSIYDQLHAVIRELINPAGDIITNSHWDNLDIANRLVGIIGGEIIPFERYVCILPDGICEDDLVLGDAT